jgi:hypothetical protein
MDSRAVLTHADPLPAADRASISRLAKKLARAGAFLGVRYDSESGRLELFKVPERIPATGRRPKPRLRAYKGRRGDRAWGGSVQVARGGSWSGRIDVPAGGGAALITIERKGKGSRLLPADAALAVPEGEAEALLALVEGLLAKSHRGR